ncbi:unnamed protein product, partial [Porites evermanni]
MGIILDKTARIPSLEDGKQYEFLGVLESVMQHYELILEYSPTKPVHESDDVQAFWDVPVFADHEEV